MAGAALGAVFVGAAVSAVAPPLGIAVGAAVGAYTGSLVGALAKMEDVNDVDVTTDVPARKAGIMVAVNVDSGVGLDRISALLKEYGASNVEMWEGRWENGAWSDFDPTSTPHRID